MGLLDRHLAGLEPVLTKPTSTSLQSLETFCKVLFQNLLLNMLGLKSISCKLKEIFSFSVV